MMRERFRTYLLLCMTLTAFTPSCAVLYRATAPVGHEKMFVEDTAKQAQAHLAAGEYRKALELYAERYGKYRYQEMRAPYAGTAEQIRGAADAAHQRKDFADAWNIYHALYESDVTDGDFSPPLSFDDDYLKRQMKASSKGVLETGLTKYREGKLEDAIALWKMALEFDPDNKELKSSIDTATTQLQNLKQIK